MGETFFVIDYNKDLAREHKEFTREIYGMIRSLEEYSKLESR